MAHSNNVRSELYFLSEIEVSGCLKALRRRRSRFQSGQFKKRRLSGRSILETESVTYSKRRGDVRSPNSDICQRSNGERIITISDDVLELMPITYRCIGMNLCTVGEDSSLHVKFKESSFINLKTTVLNRMKQLSRFQVKGLGAHRTGPYIESINCLLISEMDGTTLVCINDFHSLLYSYITIPGVSEKCTSDNISSLIPKEIHPKVKGKYVVLEYRIKEGDYQDHFVQSYTGIRPRTSPICENCTMPSQRGDSKKMKMDVVNVPEPIFKSIETGIEPIHFWSEIYLIDVLTKELEKVCIFNEENEAFSRQTGPVLDHYIPETHHIFYSQQKQGFRLEFFIARLVEFFQCSRAAFVVMFIYLDRSQRRCNSMLLTELNCHRLILTALVLAIKYLDDEDCGNSFYAEVGGVKPHQLNELELSMLSVLDWNLNVSPTVYELYESRLRIAAKNVFIVMTGTTNVLHSSHPISSLLSMYGSFNFCYDPNGRMIVILSN